GSGSASPETNERIYYLGVSSIRKSTSDDAAAIKLSGEPKPLVTYRRKLRIEKDNSMQTHLGNFLTIREMRWVWEELEPGKAMRYTFRVPGLQQPVPDAKGAVQMYYAGVGLTGPVTLKIGVNGTVLEEGATLNSTRELIEIAIPSGLLRHDTNFLDLTLQAPAAPGARPLPPVYFDALELEYESLFKADDGRQLAEFSSDKSATGPVEIRAVGFRPHRLLAADVTDPGHPILLPVREGDGQTTLQAELTPESRILLTENDAVPRAPKAHPARWLPLRDADQSADVLVIHHGLFTEAAERLGADLRASGREVRLVDVESLYDAFSFGEITVQAIRDYTARAVNTWTGRRPTHLLLVGDCTSDGQRRSKNDVLNYVPTFVADQKRGAIVDEYATDQFAAWVCGQDELADMIVGRLSVANTMDAGEVVDRTIRYRALGPQPWANRFVTLTDPGEFQRVSSEVEREDMAPWIEARTLHTPEFAWEDNFYLPKEALQGDEVKVSPIATKLLQDEINRGAGVVTFYGHGSPNIWSNQRVWFGGDSANSDNLRLTNRDRPVFMTSFTCNNGAIDYPVPKWNICISEDMMRVPGGGAIGCFVPSGPGYTERHLRLAEGFFRSLTQLGVREFGMAAELARLNYQAQLGSDDHSRMFILLGDPTLELPCGSGEVTVTVSPEVVLSTADWQTLRVQVSAAEPLTSGTVLLLGRHGEPLAEAGMQPTDGGVLEAQLEAALPVEVGQFRVVARATGASGQLYLAGKDLYRAPGEVVIESFEMGAANKEAGSREASYTIVNRSPNPQFGELTITRLSNREPETAARLPFELQPGERRQLSAAVKAPPGAHTLTATIYPAPGTAMRQELPSASSTDCLIIPEQQPVANDLAIPPGAFRILPARTRNSSPIIETFVANLGTMDASCSIGWKITYPNQSTVNGSKTVGSVPAGAVRRARVPMTMALDMTTYLSVSMTSNLEGRRDMNPGNDGITKRLTPRDLPDLRVAEGSLEVLPSHLSEGVTVMVRGEVENAGAVRSADCDVGLFAADDRSFSEPLRSLAGNLRNHVPPLEPGGRWPFLVRWDPREAGDIQAIRLLVDSRQVLVESDKANNEQLVPISIKKGWKLAARGISAREGGQPMTLILAARVANEGETDAQRVSVFFYKDEVQTQENLLGEVLVDRVPAGGMATVEWPWNFAGEDLTLKRRPSFSVGLKGSLQRISSVSE
ncbi:hypothetical protein HZA57_00470, partial [Candidatus Poribacteria bacterium]|nr:hypothetical protein [Candidatus Poribacteria bacterium]